MCLTADKTYIFIRFLHIVCYRCNFRRRLVVTLDFTTNRCYTSFGDDIMQVSSRFTIAIHIFSCINTFKDEYKITGDFLASSIQVNPVIIRKLLGQLKEAGLIKVKRGSGGASIAKEPCLITLLDVFNSVESLDDGKLFHFHENPNPNCPVGRSIHPVLDGRLKQIQQAMEDEMQSITLEDIFNDTKKFIESTSIESTSKNI